MHKNPPSRQVHIKDKKEIKKRQKGNKKEIKKKWKEINTKNKKEINAETNKRFFHSMNNDKREMNNDKRQMNNDKRQIKMIRYKMQK